MPHGRRGLAQTALLWVALVLGAAGSAAGSGYSLVPIARLDGSAPHPYASFGESVAISGDRVAVGVPGAEGPAGVTGAVYLFERNQGAPEGWGEVRRIVPAGATDGARFGEFVALDGDTLIVGAPSQDDTLPQGYGAVYVFERNASGPGAWGQTARLTPSTAGGATYEDFGDDLALDGDVAVLGGRERTSPSLFEDVAYVFERDRGGPGAWGQARRLSPVPGESNFAFGTSLAVAGDTIVAGHPEAEATDTGPYRCGAAFVFERDQDGPGSWGLSRKIVASDPVQGEGFGLNVALSGDLLAVTSASNHGSVYLFERNAGGPATWGQIRKITGQGGSAPFAISVALHGDRLAAGKRAGRTSGADTVYIFDRDHPTEDAWGERQRLTNPGTGRSVDFGESLDLDGTDAVVGAGRASGPAGSTGTAFVYSAGPTARISPPSLTFVQGAPPPVYVEIDWVEDDGHSHRPTQDVLDRIARTFAAAGHSIHLDVSNRVEGVVGVDLPGDASPSEAPEVQAILDANFDHAADPRYHYSLWAHDFSLSGWPTGSSGIADLPGRVHLVTLGDYRYPDYQVGTFIHELGHNLSQRHGGSDHAPYKPGYLSVMNYHYQLGGIGPSLVALGFAGTAAGFDDFSYSHGMGPILNEWHLDERFGLGLGRAVDWDCDGEIEASVTADIRAPRSAEGGYRCSDDDDPDVVADFDNWSDLLPHIRTEASPPALAAPTRSEICPSLAEAEPLRRRIESLRAAGVLRPEDEVPLHPPRKIVARGAAGAWFSIANDGPRPLLVTAMSADTGGVEWTPRAPFTVQPGQVQRVLVHADFANLPVGTHVFALEIGTNDPSSSLAKVPLTVSSLGACRSLAFSRTGFGADPVPQPANSAGCPFHQYRPSTEVTLTAAPATGWRVAGWTGTADDASTETTNSLLMPDADFAVAVRYEDEGGAGMDFHTIAPCRVLNTRESAALASQTIRTFPVAGRCGIPATARAIAANVTAVGPTDRGRITLFPGDGSAPSTSTVNFARGETRANSILLPLASNGDGTFRATAFLIDGGKVDLLLDVSGYFE